MDERTAYQTALGFLKECSTPFGFIAASIDSSNYRRIWSRDGVICGLAALIAGDGDLVDTFRRTLETLRKFQMPWGQIPSNVSLNAARGEPDGQVSYGTLTGRVDATLWYVVGCVEFYNRTQDEVFWIRHQPSIASCLQVLRVWEYNDKGLLYVPKGGDWADEYILDGYVLTDQILYWRAQQEYGVISGQRETQSRADHLQGLIQSNYWLNRAPLPLDSEMIYHPAAYQAAYQRQEPHLEYFVPSLSPTGYRFMFDATANSLALLTGLADPHQVESIVNYTIGLRRHQIVPLLPAFHPVIDQSHPLWGDLKHYYRYEFKNRPGAYHNGGIWPVNNGFYIAALASTGHIESARECLQALSRANGLDDPNRANTRFPEYINGLTGLPEGVMPIAWSAAATVIGHQAVTEHRSLFTGCRS